VLVGEAIRERRHAQHDLADDERFDDVVVGADLEAQDPILGLALRGQHQHPGIGDRGIGADRLAHVVPRRIRQHQVQDHDVGVVCLDRREAFGPVRRRDDRKARAAQVELEEPRDIAFVFDDDHPAFH